MIIVKEGPNQEERIKRMLDVLRTGLIANESYFNECDIITQWILKICDSYPFLANVLRNQKVLLETMIKILSSGRNPSNEVLKKHVIFDSISEKSKLRKTSTKTS